jgi:hypothetical protein
VAAQPQPVVFRPRSLGATAIWAVLGVGFTLLAAVFVLTNVGLHLSPSPVIVGVFAVVVFQGLLNRVRPLGLDRSGLHIGSVNDGYVVPWSNITGIVTVPRTLLSPERIRIRISDSRLMPGWWARLRWGFYVRPAAELELQLSNGVPSAEIADEIRRFIDAYG